MSPIPKWLTLFLLGLSDSMSLSWIRRILLVTHPTNKKIHPSSLELLSTFKNTFIQVFVFLIGLPFLIRYLGYDFVAGIIGAFFLMLTYGYLFFYNTEVMVATKKVALWSAKFPNTNFCEFDNRQKAQLFYSLSNQLKSFIFLLLYYTPIFLICLSLLPYLPAPGTLLLCISQSFFNGTFYFLKKWPYDRFNVAFIEKNIPYMLGYGFFVSVLCNVCLGGDLSRGAYFIVSQWMIINCLLYSPPEIEKDITLGETVRYMTSPEARATLPNAYNIHRRKIRKDKEYREKVISDIRILRPALLITQKLNSYLAKGLTQGLNLQNRETISETEAVLKGTQSTQVSATGEISSGSTGSNKLQIVSQVYEPEDEGSASPRAQN